MQLYYYPPHVAIAAIVSRRRSFPAISECETCWITVIILEFCLVPLMMQTSKSAASALRDLLYKLQKGSKGRWML